MENLLKTLHLGKHFIRYRNLFDRRTYESFKAVLSALVYLKEPVQADCAELVGKSLSALQYFFQNAKWDVRELGRARLSVLRNKPETEDRSSDILVLDGCPLAKDKDALSQLIARIWDNRKKQVVNGYELFGAAIVTEAGHHYPLHVMLFLPDKWNSVFCGWISFLRRCLGKTKALLVVIDRGFRNKYFLQAILEHGRQFLIRIDAETAGLFPEILTRKQARGKSRRGRKRKFTDRYSLTLKKYMEKAEDIRKIPTGCGILSVIPNVIVKAWSDTVTAPGAMLFIQRNGFKNPLVLFASEVPADISSERALELLRCYFRRWRIEQIFKEEKQLFCMEGFKVTTIKAIIRYIHLVMVAYMILFIKNLRIASIGILRKFIEFYLKKKRNIKKITLSSLKIFYEKCHEFHFDFSSIFPLFLKEKLGFEI